MPVAWRSCNNVSEAITRFATTMFKNDNEMEKIWLYTKEEERALNFGCFHADANFLHSSCATYWEIILQQKDDTGTWEYSTSTEASSSYKRNMIDFIGLIVHQPNWLLYSAFIAFEVVLWVPNVNESFHNTPLATPKLIKK